mmetsp:Transcript_13088/g.29508  ORF Transcript_13088/g.29508 Transcript_13088/m.29508 type:complete len:296 (-) Transcript_13088:1377-2264(-)
MPRPLLHQVRRAPDHHCVLAAIAVFPLLQLGQPPQLLAIPQRPTQLVRLGQLLPPCQSCLAASACSHPPAQLGWERADLHQEQFQPLSQQHHVPLQSLRRPQLLMQPLPVTWMCSRCWHCALFWSLAAASLVTVSALVPTARSVVLTERSVALTASSVVLIACSVDHLSNVGSEGLLLERVPRLQIAQRCDPARLRLHLETRQSLHQAALGQILQQYPVLLLSWQRPPQWTQPLLNWSRQGRVQPQSLALLPSSQTAKLRYELQTKTHPEPFQSPLQREHQLLHQSHPALPELRK